MMVVEGRLEDSMCKLGSFNPMLVMLAHHCHSYWVTWLYVFATMVMLMFIGRLGVTYLLHIRPACLRGCFYGVIMACMLLIGSFGYHRFALWSWFHICSLWVCVIMSCHVPLLLLHMTWSLVGFMWLIRDCMKIGPSFLCWKLWFKFYLLRNSFSLGY